MRDEMPAIHERVGLPQTGWETETVQREWILKKNCSLSPAQLIAVFSTLAGLSVLVSGYWALQGAWVVVPFAVLECLALALAFLCYARHSTDREEVSLLATELVVERTVGSRTSRMVLPRSWLRVRMDEDSAGLVWCQAGSKEVPLGQFVDHEGRRRFYQELRASIRPAFG